MDYVPFHMLGAKVPDSNHHVHCFLVGSDVSYRNKELCQLERAGDETLRLSAIPQGTADQDFNLISAIHWFCDICKFAPRLSLRSQNW